MNMSKLITFAAVAACAAFAAMADKKQFSALDGEEAKRVKTHNLDGSPVVCESVATVEGREASLLPKGRQFKLVWNDEFDGEVFTFDDTPRNGQMPRNCESTTLLTNIAPITTAKSVIDSTLIVPVTKP